MCSIDAGLITDVDFLKTAEQLSLEGFVLGWKRLANALVAEDVDAFFVGPGFMFYISNEFGFGREDVLMVRGEGEEETISGGFVRSFWDH